MTEKKYLVKFTWSVQCTQDAWEMISIEKLFDESATIKDIKEWTMAKTKGKALIEVKLSEPE